MKKEINQYGFIEKENQYFYAKYEFKSKTISINNISNFVIKPLFLIQSNTDPKRLFEIRNKYNLSKIIDVPAKALVSITEFNSFVEGKGNYLMNASKIEFHRIKEKLYDLTKDAEEIKTLGWHKDGFYAFANGIYNSRFTGVDDFGIIAHKIETENGEEDRHYFIPAMSSIYRNEDESYEMEKKFVYVPRPDVKFRDWAELFCKVHKENGQIGLCYYIASVFRDIIYHRFKFFPHLFLFGPPGTGKSNMGWSISYMFGLERKPFNLNAGTAVGFHRTFAQFRNAVVWFDEYSNSIEIKRIQDLKGAYDGAGHVKGEFSATGGSSNKTTSTPVNSACIISGQELPVADNALFKRVILCQYHQTEFSEEERKLNDDLRTLQSKGLSHISGSLNKFRKKVQEEYHEVFNSVMKEFNTEMGKDSGIEERIMINASIPLAMFKLLEEELHFPFSYKEIKETFFANVRSQNGLISSAKETNTFWDQVDFLVSRGEIKDQEDFKVKRIQSVKVMKGRGESETKEFALPKDVLFLCMTKVHPLYLESLRKQGQNKGMDKNSLTHYLSHSREFIGLVNKTTFKIGDKTTSTSAYAFDYDYLEKLGYNFRRFIDGDGENDEDEKPVKAPF
jgi:hypothetical protein